MGHYNVWIKNMSRLVDVQFSKTTLKKIICGRCLRLLSSQRKIVTYERDCGKVTNWAIVLLSKDDKCVSLDNYIRKEPLSFMVYATFECTLQKTEDCGEEEWKLQSHAYQRHKGFT